MRDYNAQESISSHVCQGQAVRAGVTITICVEFSRDEPVCALLKTKFL